MRETFWTKSSSKPRFPSLDSDLTVDVAVVGGGTTGVATAYLLAESGASVAVFERDTCGSGDTHASTSHLTMVTDSRLGQIIGQFGKPTARAIWSAGKTAIDEIERVVNDLEIDCEFRRVPGYLHASLNGGNGVEDFREEAATARRLGFDATFHPEVPFWGVPGIEYPDQATLHHLKYLFGVLNELSNRSVPIFEHSEVTEVSGNPFTLKVNGHEVRCRYLAITTHVPLMGKSSVLSAGYLQTKLYPYTSYVIGARIPKDAIPDALFWDTSDPYFYLRKASSQDDQIAIFGGMDHKTGESPKGDTIQELSEILRRRIPESEVVFKWSGQVISSVDGLPYIGETADRQYIATGFVGNGITFGMLSAQIVRDAVLGKVHSMAELVRPDRGGIFNSATNYIAENLRYPYYLVKDRLSSADGDAIEELDPGCGKLMDLEDGRAAVYRDDDGKIHVLSAVCPHLGCLVRWNEFERTWDCPCHGSRFHPDGEVLAGPAERSLSELRTVEAK